ncbi:class A beta-lactamase, subclass A2 [Hymenobacter terrenus]|uniref:class A beta-lactamase, subclass A2 n=1 Tax=Hymenobacter terrenus TaxID=1629124 RepID=UPI000619AACA|nr:class A beta-lactamase, subclass A2 [Hymenobacter terrenus]
MLKHSFLASALFSLATSPAFAQTESLEQRINRLLVAKKATIGISIYCFETKEAVSINGNEHFPMLSVFKLHIAMAVLNEIDKGRFSLNQRIHVKPEDLLPDLFSPLRDEYPNGNAKIPLAKIIEYTVGKSDNSGCEILLELIGGTQMVNKYFRKAGMKDICIQVNEEEMHKNWNDQFLNWTTPVSAVEVLKLIYSRKLLSKTSSDFLWNSMAATSTAGKRIKGNIPVDAVVAHKTGTGRTNQQGITAAVNDIGIVASPNGRHFAVSVFVANSLENIETNEKVIADITRLAYDYFLTSSK